MDVTMVGLQNAGKTSLLRVLAVRTNRICAIRNVADYYGLAGRRIYDRVSSMHAALRQQRQ